MLFQTIITMELLHPLLWPAFEQSKGMLPHVVPTIQDNGKGVSMKWKDLSTGSAVCCETWIDEEEELAQKVTCVTSEGVQRIHEEKVFFGVLLRTSQKVVQKDGSYVEDVVVTTVAENPRVMRRFQTIADINGEKTTTITH